MKLSAKEILNQIGEGTILGDQNIEINSICGIENGNINSVSYIKNKSFLKFLEKTKSSIVIVHKEFNISFLKGKTILKVDDPELAFCKILKLFADSETSQHKNHISENVCIPNSVRMEKNIKIGRNCVIEENCIIEETVIISPNCFIGKNVHIKKNTIINPGVCIYKNSVIGENCIIHAGAVIGADGFGFINRNNRNIKLQHIGNVIIQNDVEIGANTCIDKGKTHSDSTIIEDNVKIDNLVQIGHNVIIGSGTVIAGLCGIAGSTRIGKNCIIGGKVAISDHLEIADNVQIAGNSGVTKSVKNKGAVLQGPIAFKKYDFQKAYIHFKNLDKNIKKSF